MNDLGFSEAKAEPYKKLTITKNNTTLLWLTQEDYFLSSYPADTNSFNIHTRRQESHFCPEISYKLRPL